MDHDGARIILNEEQRIGEVETMEIPVVDLDDDHEAIVKGIAQACEKWGFFQVVNHGIPQSIINELFTVSKEFFDLASDEKEACNEICKKFAWASQDPAGLIKYGFSFNPTKEKSHDLRNFLRLDCNKVESVDAWPPNPPNFKSVVGAYTRHTPMLLGRLLEIISEGLGLPRDCLWKSFGDEPRSIFMMNHYPPFEYSDLVKGATEHSDPSGITLLLQDMLGGLEVCNEGRWFAVKPIENAIVVNLGDQLQILTNGKYPSAEHRVRVHAHKPRFSIPVFYGPGLATKVGPLPQLVGDGGAKYKESITIDYLSHFFSRGLLSKSNLECVKVF